MPCIVFLERKLGDCRSHHSLVFLAAFFFQFTIFVIDELSHVQSIAL
jgi:hypothetical protein